MANLPCIESAPLEAVCKVLANTTYGLTGNEIGYILREINIPDSSPSLTKWKRLFNALVEAAK